MSRGLCMSPSCILSLTALRMSQMKKKCYRCSAEKNLEEFNFQKSGILGRHSWCRVCQSADYMKNRVRHLAQVRAREKRIEVEHFAKIMDYLLGHPCIDCGETDPIVLEFDHVRGEKVRAVSELVALRQAWSKIEAEIEKCDVRCANCHRRKTALQFNWRKARPPSGNSVDRVPFS